jgi:drug/metabolite transporter (DMT)-like permease
LSVARKPAAAPAGAAGRDLTGYALVIASYLVFGLSATLVTWADAPQSVLLVIRFALATVALLLIFARRNPLKGVFVPGNWQRLLAMGALDAFTLIGYFYAVRAVGVATATFFFFLQPVWVALMAPRLLRTATERVVYLALSFALAGMVLILVPAFVGEGVRMSVLGLAAALAAGWSYAFFLLLVKPLTKKVSSITLVIVESFLDTVFLLPLALWQFVEAGRGLSYRDWVAAVIMGLVATALGYTMWAEGVARIRVQHSSILGLITPVAAPVYAFVLLGQTIAGWTLAGGALILFAAALVVLKGGGEPEPDPPL